MTTTRPCGQHAPHRLHKGGPCGPEALHRGGLDVEGLQGAAQHLLGIKCHGSDFIGRTVPAASVG
jgi:hypothetical protein